MMINVYIKDFNRFMFCKTKTKNKKYFCKSCLQCFSNENVLTKHEKDCLIIIGEQSVKLEKGTIEFTRKKYQFHLKSMLILSVILKMLEFMKGITQKSIKNTILVVLLTELFVLMIYLLDQLLCLQVKLVLLNLLKQFLRSMNIAKE